MGQDLLDRCGLFDERDDAHGSAAAGTHERIDFVDLRDEASTSSAERRAHARLVAALETALRVLNTAIVRFEVAGRPSHIADLPNHEPQHG
jgi:hypothetical protein